ncbi:MAG TPA: sigma-70 family RNA polymerase sigma factor [Azospirillaceae bacterium]|nr:sigma-70 family RNA polymerase sigma factor [Azospirillaceae bacterium]HRQ81251.1 sigma-70 family RNA polymerase sigma factor [Azospirillaceae bacterium]
MAEIAAGGRAAFDVLCRRHLQRSVRLAYRVQPCWRDAEEIAQDAFLQVWDQADSWRADAGARFSTWFYRVVVNRAIDYRRRHKSFSPLEDAGDPPSPDLGAEAAVEERQLAACIDAVIADLPERQRAALALCYYDELTCAEAARVMEVSVSAMESLLVRARRAARSKLRDIVGMTGAGLTDGGET